MSELNHGPADDLEVASPGAIDDSASSDFQTTESGLMYRILREGDDQNPSESDRVEVHYKGWLDDESIFDSSYRRGETIAFPLNGVIPGWTEGMQLVGKGGMIELQIPSSLGYGPRGMPPVIPGDAQLHFLVELIDIH
ncbi:FKBP-type peptidyl-prolyl cis-trans isomerase [Rubripirellula amarantea]|nr:FKBP-type peptidyl-prolyl cis-trans isomerase [Rubripirellula amarantea]